ncbi:hypothetical protein N7486_000956 [Penicillium sp. IBT 16267x]|nr:hypothetical protein N7486_000956 [Penicillium sp. IBT 16267x]
MAQLSFVDLPPQLRLYPTCGVKKEKPKPLFYFLGFPGSKRTGFESLKRLHLDRKALRAKVAYQRKVDIVRSNLLLASVPSPPPLPPLPRLPVMAGILKAPEVPRTSALDRRVHFGEVEVLEVERWMPQRPRSILKASEAPHTSALDRRVHFGGVEVVEVERWMQQRARKPHYHPCPPPGFAIFPLFRSVFTSPGVLTLRPLPQLKKISSTVHERPAEWSPVSLNRFRLERPLVVALCALESCFC